MGKQVRSRRARRHHLELVSSEEWPDDLFPLLQMARDGMLEQESPAPTPEVLAYLEEPAHGKVDGDGLLLRSLEVEPIELTPLEPERRRTPRRALVATAGAAAAIALVVLGLRPTFTGPKTTITSARTSVPVVEPTASSTVAPPTEPDASTVPETLADPVPDVQLPPEVTAPAASTPDTTVAPAAHDPGPADVGQDHAVDDQVEGQDVGHQVVGDHGACAAAAERERSGARLLRRGQRPREVRRPPALEGDAGPGGRGLRGGAGAACGPAPVLGRPRRVELLCGPVLRSGDGLRPGRVRVRGRAPARRLRRAAEPLQQVPGLIALLALP